MIDDFNEKFILNFTPTGMIPTRQMTPYVPIHINEIIEQVLEVAEIGVNMVHLHARNSENGEPTYKKTIYAEEKKLQDQMVSAWGIHQWPQFFGIREALGMPGT